MNKKTVFALGVFAAVLSAAFSQNDDDFFSDDDLFGDSAIVEIEETQTGKFSSELNRGSLFETGSIKIGGTFKTSMEAKIPLYADDEKSFTARLEGATLKPAAEALLSVDARPSNNLRMYTKFGLAYPFRSLASSLASTNGISSIDSYFTTVSTNITDYITLKELFTDFSFADRAFFRFGKHTVTWGTGYFFSPVSDMINTSMIDPESTDSQVDGSLNLRTQITFSGTQNCLWFYIIPSTDFLGVSSAESYLNKTAFAAKADLVFGGWEFGLGAYWRHEDSPRAMLTASGTLFSKIGFFAEGVYQHGTQGEWSADKSYGGKSGLFFATAGLNYYWKTPEITFAAQYYFDGFDVKDFDLVSAISSRNYSDMTHNYFTKGHNVAAVVNFARIFGTRDFGAVVFGMVNFGKEKLDDSVRNAISSSSGTFLSTATFSATMNWTPFKNFKIGVGPYITFEAWNRAPSVDAKISLTLGGGKF